MRTRFDIIANTYEAALQKYPEARTDANWLIKNLEIKENDKILEFTAGTGFLTQKMALLNPKGFLVTQDISPIMLSFNRKKCKKYPNVNFYCEKNSSFPKIKNNYFNKAVCLGGFHHLEDPTTVLKTIHSKIKKKGICCIGDFADNSSVQKYFDERIHKLTSTGHKGLFLTISRMINLGRFTGFNAAEAINIKVPFIFNSEKEIGEFYNLVHGLNENATDTLKDIKNYMGIKKVGDRLIVPMDYVYAKYIK